MIVKKVVNKHGSDARSRVHGLIDYVTTAQTREGDEKCLYSRCWNVFSGDIERAKAEIMALQVAGHNTRSSRERDFMKHWIISFKGLERPEMKDIERASERFLKEMGLGDHQAVMGVHVNTDNIHVHLAVSMINPATHTLASSWHDIRSAHAILAGIERSLGAEPERNAMFSWNVLKGAVPNKRYRHVSRRFAYASPEVVMVTLPPDAPKPEFPGWREKGCCWFYEGQRDACAIWDNGRIWFMNWNYRDTIDRIMSLKEMYPRECDAAGNCVNNGKFAVVTVQRELAPYFVGKRGHMPTAEEKEELEAVFQGGDMNVFTGGYTAAMREDGQVEARGRPPFFAFDAGEPRERDPWKFYLKAKRRCQRRREPVIRLRSLAALSMRAHGFDRADIERSLAADGMGREEAKALSRWIYTPAGKTELFRQRMQGTLLIEKSRRLSGDGLRKKGRPVPRLRFGLSGEITDISRRRPEIDESAILWHLLRMNSDDTTARMRKVREQAPPPARSIRESGDSGAVAGRDAQRQDRRASLTGRLK